MDAFLLYEQERSVDAVVDPFMDFEPDAATQTGSDWFNLMLSASVGGLPVHGATLSATSETLSKQTETFANGHAIGRIRFDDREKKTSHASTEWYYRNLSGKSYHGTKSSNKARMLFDSGEWEPSQRTRAKNAAFIGALLTTGGATLESALTVASAIAGEVIPADAITRTELPMQVVKREAAASAKPNHIVYSHGNAHRAVQWEDSQYRQEILPPNAAADWSRITTIARYIGEGNVMVDEQFKNYAADHGVPYAIVMDSWAHVSTADYILDPALFALVDLGAAKVLPTTALAEAYSHHAEALYDSIHRVSNEMAMGITDPSLEALVRAAEALRKKKGKTKLATGTYMLAEPSLHRYTAEKSAQAVAESARSWDALTKSSSELILSKRSLHTATNNAVLAYREHSDYKAALEPLLSELCKAAIWQRANAYLTEMLNNKSKSLERMSKLRRTMLRNSAPISVDVILTARIREACTPQAMALARRVISGDIPRLKIAVDARYNLKDNSIAEQRTFVSALNQHLTKSKVDWVDRYTNLAAAYSIRKGPDDNTKSVEFGSAAKAFATITGYLITQVDTGFIDPPTLQTSYLYQIAKNYVRKRHITNYDFGVLVGLDASAQAIALDVMLQPPISFTHIELYCRGKLSQFYNDIVTGNAPVFHEADVPNEPAEEIEDDIDIEALERELASLDNTPTMVIDYDTVLRSYDSERTAEEHAKANGHDTFLDAYMHLRDRARYDIDSVYTQQAMANINRRKRVEEKEDPLGMPVI